MLQLLSISQSGIKTAKEVASEKGKEQKDIKERREGARMGASSISWPIMPTWGGHFRYT